jgi:ubiquinone/menaquinone biosynthesis C-methylase UbiE
MTGEFSKYTSTYARFTSELNVRIRREVFGEDIGQNSWTTADEQRAFATASGLNASSRLLEVGCGSGGPALFLVRNIGLTVTGIDTNEAGIAAAAEAAQKDGISGRANFLRTDAAGRLPFADGAFDAIHSIDVFNHIPDRPALLRELHRVLRPGGTLLYTDPVVVTGPVTSEELADRSAIGFFVFMPEGANERMLQEAGYRLLRRDDRTANAVAVSSRWMASRARWRDDLIAGDGPEIYELSVRFTRAVNALAASGRLSRFMYLAQKD